MLNKKSSVMKLSEIISNEYYDSRNNFLGKVLTIIDASISDPEQRKGIKDLIRGVNYQYPDWYNRRMNMAIKQFNDKFAKVPLTPKDSQFLETGEWPLEEGTAKGPSLNQDYFLEE